MYRCAATGACCAGPGVARGGRRRVREEVTAAHLCEAAHAPRPHSRVVLGAPREIWHKVPLQHLPVGGGEARVGPECAILGRLRHAAARPGHLEELVHLEVAQHLDQALSGQREEVERRRARLFCVPVRRCGARLLRRCGLGRQRQASRVTARRCVRLGERGWHRLVTRLRRREVGRGPPDVCCQNKKRFLGEKTTNPRFSPSSSIE